MLKAYEFYEQAFYWQSRRSRSAQSTDATIRAAYSGGYKAGRRSEIVYYSRRGWPGQGSATLERRQKGAECQRGSELFDANPKA